MKKQCDEMHLLQSMKQKKEALAEEIQQQEQRIA